MAYTKTVYQDGVTGITAATLNNAEEQIELLSSFGLGGLATRLTTGYNIHNLYKNGWYDVENPVNGVSGWTWHKILCICSGDANYVTLLAFTMTDTSSKMSMKQKTSGTWGSWKRIYGYGDIPIYENLTLTGHSSIDRMQGLDNDEIIYLGSGNCSVDMSGGDARWRRNATDYISHDANGVYFYFGGAIKHQFNANGTKSGGSIVIDEVNYGLSPVDCPQVLIEDVLFDVAVEEAGTVVTLDAKLAKVLSKYAVFPSVGSCIISEKTETSFKVLGYTGVVDLNIKGKRIDSTDVNWKVLD